MTSCWGVSQVMFGVVVVGSGVVVVVGGGYVAVDKLLFGSGTGREKG